MLGWQFAHAPATGGKAFRRALGFDPAPAHVPLVVLRDRHPPDRIVSIVRDPLERAVSMHWISTGDSQHTAAAFRRWVADGCQWGGWHSFPGYSREPLPGPLGSTLASHRWSAPQVDFARGADVVLRYEDFDAEVARFCGIAGVRAVVPEKVVGTFVYDRPTVADVMDARSEATIRDIYGADFELWGAL